jgi:hypothetical protein
MKAAPQSADLEPYLERLRALPFVKQVDVRHSNRADDEEEDARISLRTPKGRHDVAVEVKTVPLSRSAAQSLVARALRNPGRPWVAFSPYVPQPVGHLLASQDIGFVDQAGNYHIAVGQDYLAHVEGRRPQLPSRHGRGLGAKSYQVLFALLARPELVVTPIRSLAEAAGVRKTAAADLLRRLNDEGVVLPDKRGRRLVRPGALMDRWLAGYADKLRPHLLVGRYRAAAREPLAFQNLVEAMLGDQPNWAWGGATAAYRLTQHYRSEITTLHIGTTQPTRIQRQLNLLPAKDGPIVVLGVPGPLGLDGPAPHVANPLLVYTELFVQGDERALEAAAEIRSRYLGQIG